MKIGLLTIYIFIFLSLNINAQQIYSGEKTRIYFAKQASKGSSDSLLKNIVIENINLDNLPLERYYILKTYDNIDFNQDGINDLVLVIRMRQLESDSFDIKHPYRYNFRVFLVFNTNKLGQYVLALKCNKILNQNTEGLMGSSFKLFASNNKLILREAGKQIETKWITELHFKYDKNIENWLLQKATVCSADIFPDKETIKDIIKTFDTSIPISFEETNYYNYFPFGFSDDIP